MSNLETPKDDIHSRSIEYAIASAEMKRIQPEYAAAVARYKAARDALQGTLSEDDSSFNLI